MFTQIVMVDPINLNKNLYTLKGWNSVVLSEIMESIKKLCLVLINFFYIHTKNARLILIHFVDTILHASKQLPLAHYYSEANNYHISLCYNRSCDQCICTDERLQTKIWELLEVRR